MVRRLAVLAVLALGVFTRPAAAFFPEPGFYWNTGESGTGYAIELQDNFLFLATYTYLPNGQAVFYTSGGFLTNDTTYTGVINQFSGGSCITCTPFTPPGTPQNAGTVTIVFDTEQSANITWNGRTFRIERFNFLLGSKTDQMLGEWTMFLDWYNVGTDYRDYPFFGDLVIFDSSTAPRQPDTSTTGAGQSTPTSCAPRPRAPITMLRASTTRTTGEQTFLVTDDGRQRQQPGHLCRLLLRRARAPGSTSSRASSSSASRASAAPPSRRYFPMRGFRSASKRFVQTGAGPNAADDKAIAASAPPTPGLYELVTQRGDAAARPQRGRGQGTLRLRPARVGASRQPADRPPHRQARRGPVAVQPVRPLPRGSGSPL